MSKIIGIVISVLMSGFTMLASTANTVIGATEGEPIIATEREYKFDRDRLLIGGYNSRNQDTGVLSDDEHFTWMKEAGLDFVLSGGLTEEYLDQCEKYGIGVIAMYDDMKRYYEIIDDGGTSWLSMTEETLAGRSDAIWGDYLVDEPYYHQFDLAASMAESYYKNTDRLMPLINLFPIDAVKDRLTASNTMNDFTGIIPMSFFQPRHEAYREYLSDYINKVDTDYICMDIYPLSVDDSGKKTEFRHWLRCLDIVSEACRTTNRDFWIITQLQGQNEAAEGYKRPADETDIRWQSYISLSFGAKAIIHSCYDRGWKSWDTYSCAIGPDGEKTPAYTAMQTVNLELQKISEIYGKYDNQGAFLAGSVIGNMFNTAGCRDAVSLTSMFMPVDEQYKPTVSTNSPVLVGCFTGDNNTSAFTFVNMTELSEEKTVNASATFDGAEKVTVYRGGEPTVIEGSSATIELAPGEGVFVTVE